MRRYEWGLGCGVTGAPALQVVYAGGYSPESAGKELKLQPGEALVQKPVGSENRVKIIRAALDG